MPKDRNKYIFEMYLICQDSGNLLFIDNDSLIDIEHLPKEKNEYHFGIKDEYFKCCFEFVKPIDVKIIIIHYEDGKFIQQLEISSENITLTENTMVVIVDQCIFNNIGKSILPQYAKAAEQYSMNRNIFMRNKKISEILN